jgi:hypothetical protein
MGHEESNEVRHNLSGGVGYDNIMMFINFGSYVNEGK